ncbi:hypothetical protein PGB90_003172 [Kerria lacca]
MSNSASSATIHSTISSTFTSVNPGIFLKHFSNVSFSSSGSTFSLGYLHM